MAGEPFEPTGDLPKSARLSFYTPLLPYFLALMFACIVAGTFCLREYSNAFLAVGSASILLEITLRFFASIFSVQTSVETYSFSFSVTQSLPIICPVLTGDMAKRKQLSM